MDDYQASPESLDKLYELDPDFCISAGEVTWRAPRRGGYFFARVWRRGDPQMAIKCTHRHRTASGAIKCGLKLASENLRTEFDAE